MDAGPDVDNGMPSDMYPAPHPAPPKVIGFGGPTLKNPKFQSVYFMGDDAMLTAQIDDYTSKVGATMYWAANVTEYGVGPATALPSVQLMEAAPTTIDDTGIQTWLAGKLNGNDPAFAVPDADTVYAIYYPTGTSITIQGGGASCSTFGGYHSNITLDAMHGSMDVPYIVVPRCDNFGGMVGIDAVTATASHEMVEAATDPHPMTFPAYAQIDDAHIYWERFLGGGEIGDMCAQFPNAFTKFAELPYIVQRSWSNKAAKAGSDPCVPELPGEVYFNAAPDLPDTITASFGGQMVKIQGVKIPVGMSRAIDVDLFSEAKTSGPMTVKAIDGAAAFGQPAKLSFAWDRTKGVNGEKLHLTITVMTAGKNNRETFLLEAQIGSQKNLWIGLVGN